MRLKVATLRRLVKGKLHIEFVRQGLTSYSGLEVLRCGSTTCRAGCAPRVLAQGCLRRWAAPRPGSERTSHMEATA